MSWNILYTWYGKITVRIKWNKLGKEIKIYKGTRQGGLTSSMLFNLFYKDLIDELESCDGGVAIGNKRFNVFCYADDILIASTTVTGLQNLINVANRYIINHGLRFNPSKTTCIINGKNPFLSKLKWYIGDCATATAHIHKRISSCRNSFYSLQGAGLCNTGLNIDTAVYVFKSTCHSILTYACDSLHLSNKDIQELDKLQAKLIKCVVGLGPKYR